MIYKTTEKNEFVGAGKLLAWSEPAGCYFMGDESGVGQGKAESFAEDVVLAWIAEGKAVEVKQEGGAE